MNTQKREEYFPLKFLQTLLTLNIITYFRIIPIHPIVQRLD